MVEFISSRKNTAHGKSYCILVVLSAIAKFCPNVSFTICDYKNSFKQFHDLPNFYGYKKAVDGIRKFYDELQYRIEHNGEQEEPYPMTYLFVDELSSLVQAQKTKKEKDDLLEMISNILNLGREYSCRIIVRYAKTEMPFSLKMVQEIISKILLH